MVTTRVAMLLLMAIQLGSVKAYTSLTYGKHNNDRFQRLVSACDVESGLHSYRAENAFNRGCECADVVPDGA